jgi:hypothetical protein
MLRCGIVAIRKQVSVDSDTHRRLRALELVTGRRCSELVAEALGKLLAADPSLAARVAQAEGAAL